MVYMNNDKNRIDTKKLTIKHKVAKILNDLDLHACDYGYDLLLNEGIAMKEFGYTWLEIDKALNDKLDLLGLRLAI